ncbi:hypothetical protein GF420_04470 [candidate division GN15 bacterium]|nr:hypothetical protein [candidate division GN15 bacterium]
MHRLKGWQKLVIGLVVVTGVTIFFMSGYSPPGPAGEVLRHNQTNDIDASPLFYSEVEHMAELEKGVAAMRDSVASDSAGRADDSASTKNEATSANPDNCKQAKVCNPLSERCE